MSKFGVHVATWNVENTQPPKDLSALVGLPESEYVIDILAVGLQEIPWGLWTPSDPQSRDNPWLSHLTSILGKSEFVLLTATHMCGTYLAIFVQRSVLPFVTSIESAQTPTGFYGLLGTKGVVSVRFQLHGTWFCFVNSHLAAHVWNSMTRIWEYDTILDYHSYTDHSKIMDHDYVFWFGDLNFRIEGIERDKINEAIKSKAYSDLFEYDQLTKFQRQGLVFTDFEESGLYFPPTYKKVVGKTSEYIVCPKRLPSWCDRVLYSSAADPYSINVLDYSDLPSLTTSDHTPVFLQANVAIPHAASNSLVRFSPVNCESMPTSQDSSLILSCLFTFAGGFKASPNDKISIYPKYFARLDDYILRWSASEFLPLRVIKVDLGAELEQPLQAGFYCIVYHHYPPGKPNGRVAGISDYFAVGDVPSDEDEFGEEGGFANADDSADSEENMFGDVEGTRGGSPSHCRPKSARRQRSVPPRPKSARGYYDDLSVTPSAASIAGSGSVNSSCNVTPSLPMAVEAWQHSATLEDMSEDQEYAVQIQNTSLNESIPLDEELAIEDDDGGEDLLDDEEIELDPEDINDDDSIENLESKDDL